MNVLARLFLIVAVSMNAASCTAAWISNAPGLLVYAMTAGACLSAYVLVGCAWEDGYERDLKLRKELATARADRDLFVTSRHAFAAEADELRAERDHLRTELKRLRAKDWAEFGARLGRRLIQSNESE